jgi:hypothetical protein
MLIVWGKKHARRPQGWVASFCPICRSVRAHQVDQLSIVTHVYGASVDDGTPLLDELTCHDCGVLFAAPVGAIRRDAYRNSPPQPDTPQQSGYAWSMAEFDQRLELERRLRAKPSSVTRQERLLMLREPVDHLAYMQAHLMSRGPWVSIMSVGLLFALGSIIAGWILWDQRAIYQRPSAELTAWAIAMTASAAVFTPLCAWLYFALPRLASRRWRHLVARAYEPLRPTRDEVAQALANAPRTRTSPARALQPADFA